MLTVKQVCDLAGLTPRTLHYYDEIGLFKPTRVAKNGYRYYDENSLLRLPQTSCTERSICRWKTSSISSNSATSTR